ncbi:uncharacterized protein CANTADRAFT_54781 [Suhomyces tanzawaensis NRRL Y-17324]|uniref:Nucleoporin Nup133/Nup155-like N-terminal domain-containing protein n=1 Tax=Suhomyces tanzawaensis NRRL Y-17324 TaxID=984487 RepID=A0A1E4SEW5_9ASCO|nr:uncharacterized protein CANTADRAFT_54781 [Suhomyces tanzawaensis NRRL Y-17324]ODV78061.1 hypothetical protein CANTADRAFT_54781 [Suhomyces tanzawaensis NRRL Y-17324]
MSSSGSIFKPRKSALSSRSPTPAASSISFSHQNEPKTTSHFKDTALELTKNENYCISKLPALPAVFERSQGSQLINAYSDHESNYSLVIDEDAIHVWSYKSADHTPLSIQFPIERSSVIPLAILTKPSSGVSQDPGLVIIDSSSGLVKFYESVQHAPALGLINNKSLELKLDINSQKGEYITLAENVEPAGIVVATSWKRCILVSLRDFKSKPQLSSVELLSNTKSKYLSFIFGSETTNEIFDEIVSIRSGRIINHGMTQEIFILDSSGGFHIVTYQLLSASGSPYVDKKKSYSHNLTTYFKNSIDGYLPGTNLDLSFLDLWPSAEHENIYVGLCYVKESYKSPNSQNLLLLTMRIDPTGVLPYGSHKLSRYNPEEASINKPRLFLPKPGKTAFVSIDNSMIITDINISYVEESAASVSYYTPRWEDVVRLRSNIDILGYGYEDQTFNNNPSAILLTRNNGVLRIERFPTSIDGGDSTDPLLIVKSHIEQAIFYFKSEEIEFDVVQQFSDETVLQAVSQIIEEITSSSSPYLPSFLPSITDFLALKVELFERFITYTQRNFPSVFPIAVSTIVDALEKNDFALQLWIQIEAEKAYSNTLKSTLEQVIIETQVVAANEDTLRKFFSQGINSVNEVFTKFVEKLLADDFSLPILTSLIVQATYYGILKNEIRYLADNELIPLRKIWVFETPLLIRIEQVFTSEYCEGGDEVKTQKSKEDLIKLCEVLYYFVTSAIQYMQLFDANNDQLKEYVQWYKGRNTHWISALLKQDLIQQGIEITEKYHDFSSLAQILEFQKKRLEDIYGEDSFEVDSLLQRYVYYFERFKYEFASLLYDYYVKNDQIQALLLSFTNYKFYLEEYLEKNAKKTSKFSWIRYLLDENFNKASKVLVESASKFEAGDNLDNKEVKYSLAKLAVIAARGTGHSDLDVNMDGDGSSYLLETENSLTKIKSQKNLFSSLIKNYGGEVQLLKFDNILKGFKNSHIGNGIAQSLLSRSFDQLVNNKQLKTIDLINWLTLLKPSIIEDRGFGLALKVAALVDDKQLFEYYTRLIWLRLLTIGDDWSLLDKANLKISTDEHIKEKVRGTVLFKTFKEINLDNKLINQLELLLNSKGVFENAENDSVAQEVNNTMVEKLTGYFQKYDFVQWVISIKEEARGENE